MSIKKLKTPGTWALPPIHHNPADRSLAGRVIVGMLTCDEKPEPTITNTKKPKPRP